MISIDNHQQVYIFPQLDNMKNRGNYRTMECSIEIYTFYHWTSLKAFPILKYTIPWDRTEVVFDNGNLHRMARLFVYPEVGKVFKS